MRRQCELLGVPRSGLYYQPVGESEVKMAKDHFNVKESKNLRIHAQDGRLFLSRTQTQYDIILLDAYFTDSMPFHLATKEFFELAQRKLTPNGIMLIPVGPPGAQHVLKITKRQQADGSITVARSDIYNGGRLSWVPFTKLEGDTIRGTHRK